MKTKGHHTCLFNGDRDSVLRESPFLAEDNPKEGKVQFLGAGYYFWDNNLELAKVWGNSHYDGEYAIIEIDIDLKSNSCYDLVGNRTHQIDLAERLKKLADNSCTNKLREWTLNQFITFIRNMAAINSDVFPYQMVRAIDLLNHDRYKKAQQMIRFTKEKHNYTVINPKTVICVFNKNTLNSQTKKIVFTS